MRQLIFILISIVSSYISVNAQTNYMLSVDELFERGIQNSIALQTAYQQKQIAVNNTSLAKNKQIPDVSASGMFGYVGTPIILNRDLSYKNKSNTPDWKQLYQVSASQPIYDGGKIKSNIDKAKLEEQIAELTISKNKSDLKLWLIQNYLNLYDLYKQEEIFKINIEESKKRLHDIQKMREEGMITSNDVLRNELVLTNYELSFNETQNDIAIVSQQLAIALGMDESIVYKPDSAFINSDNQLLNYEEYIQSAYNSYPDILINNTNIEVAKNNLKTTKAKFLPTLSLQASNAFQRPIPNIAPAQDFYINAWSVTLNLSYKISALFDRKHSLSAAKSQIKIQELAKERQKQNIRINIRSAYLKHLEAIDRVKSLEKSVIQANENYRIMDTKYFNQLAILTDLLDANSVQLNAELQLTNAKKNALYTYYQLLNISGKL